MTASPPPRQADHPIDARFLERWSPRSFTGEPLDRATLMSFLEAARWAPSAFNAQPWRFVYGLRDTPAWTPIFEALSASNQGWVKTASAVVAVLSRTRWIAPGKTEAQPITTHAFDAGAAWGSLALQASIAGWHAHAMAGFDAAVLRRLLSIPDEVAVHAIVAIGRRADPAQLSESQRAREFPSSRHPLSTMVAEGRFDFPR